MTGRYASENAASILRIEAVLARDHRMKAQSAKPTPPADVRSLIVVPTTMLCMDEDVRGSPQIDQLRWSPRASN
jgi:hypothetical protein